MSGLKTVILLTGQYLRRSVYSADDLLIMKNHGRFYVVEFSHKSSTSCEDIYRVIRQAKIS